MSLFSSFVGGIAFSEDSNIAQGNEDLQSSSGAVTFPVILTLKVFDNTKKDFTDIPWKGNNILLFGSEGSGINQKTNKYVDFNVNIKINDKIESLNVSNSAAIVFHYIKKLKLV